VIQLTRIGTQTSPADVGLLQTQFARQQCSLLPGLIEPRLLDTLERRIDRGEFRPFDSEGVAHDLNLADPLTLHTLYLLANDPVFLQVVRDITGCVEINSFQGRVYRLDPTVPYKDSWHDDMCDNRMIGMSINLGRTPFTGGVFQLRDRNADQTLHEVANTGNGDAIIFRLASHLQHRNTNVTGSTRKTAFAGWFRSDQPDFFR
jgi:hypothetical protein